MKRKLLSPTNVCMEAKKRLQELVEVREAIEKSLDQAPQGSVHLSKRGKQVQYYWRGEASDGRERYLSKKQQPTIKRLLQKSYEKRVIRLINVEIEGLERFLKQAEGISVELQESYSVFPEHAREMIVPIDMTDVEFEKKWMHYEFIPKEIPDVQKVFQTERGELVRSKSELNIANALYRHGIPYRYECPLRLNNGQIIHPDFSILNRRTRTTIYWEHRGMMEDREYAKHAILRVKEYAKNDICLGKDLIITEESTTVPLGTKEIEMIIREYLK